MDVLTLDYGCIPADPQGNVPPGLTFCAAHLSYGYKMPEPCHAAHYGSTVTGWPVRIATIISGRYIYLGPPAYAPAPDAIGTLTRS